MPVRERPTLPVGTADPSGAAGLEEVLRALDRTDGAIRRDLLRLVECYSGEPGSWDVDVRQAVATIRRIQGRPADSERLVVRALAHSVPGVVSIRVLDGSAHRTPVPVTA